MTRMRRAIAAGVPHHITQRGNRRGNVFVDDQDRLVFLRLLSEASARHSLIHFSYCLMTNHIHLVSNPIYDYSLSCAMHDLLGSYAAYFNWKHALNGRLWQGRYFSSPLDESHFWSAVRYVERNPVRAGIVERAEDYRWSSAAAHCGLRPDALLAPLPYESSPPGDWRRWLLDDNTAEELKSLRNNTKTGRPCGSDDFIEGLEHLLGRSLRPQKAGRPRKNPVNG